MPWPIGNNTAFWAGADWAQTRLLAHRLLVQCAHLFCTKEAWSSLLLFVTSHSLWEYTNIPYGNKEAFFSDQCREIEENNRMGKTSNLFNIIRDTKGTFHAKIGIIKDRNGIDLTEAEDIKKRWQEYTEEPCKRDLHDPDNHMVWSLT